MVNIKGVILDFDDTLCLTEAACFKLENETLLTMGRKPMSREVHKQTWGMPVFEAAKIRSPGVDVEVYRRIYAKKLREALEVGEYDVIPKGNLKALDDLRDDGYGLMILTNREKSELEHLLDKNHALSERISSFYYKDNMEFHKPDPRAFQHIEREHGWKPGECVYVGDSPGDAAAAKQAGLHFIASLESGLRSKEDFEGLPVDIFINHFSEVVDAVRSLER